MSTEAPTKLKGIDHAFTTAGERHFVTSHRFQSAQRLRLLVLGLGALSCLSTATVHAQDYYVVPLLTVQTLYDDNIFFDTEDEVSDVILRVSPQLDVGYSSATLNWLLSYRNDAEWYRDLSDLDSTTARGFGNGVIEYTPNRRLSMDASVSYIQTNSIQDLTLIPGGEIPGRVGRAEAERFGIGAGASYAFTPNWTGALDLDWVNDDLIGLGETETRTAVALLEQTLAADRSLLYGYRYRDYDFTRQVAVEPIEVIETSASSHTPWVGLTQALSETSDLELRAGARFSDSQGFLDDDDEVEPYLLFRWERGYARGNTVVQAAWDETAVVAQIDQVDSKSIQGFWNHRMSDSFDFGASATYAQLSGTGYEAETASFAVFGNYRFNRFVYLTGRYSFNSQDVDPTATAPQGKVDHNVISLSITFTRPRPAETGDTI